MCTQLIPNAPKDLQDRFVRKELLHKAELIIFKDCTDAWLHDLHLWAE